MRISDWSSDVCSSDLLLGHLGYQRTKAGRTGSRYLARIVSRAARLIVVAIGCRGDSVPADSAGDGGRRLSARGGAFRVARDRKSVVSGKSVSVRVDLGGRRIIKTKIDRQ